MKTQEQYLEVMSGILACIVILISIIYSMPKHMSLISGLVLAYIISYYKSEHIYIDEQPLSDCRVTTFILLIFLMLSQLFRFNIVAIICLLAIYYVAHVYEKHHYDYLVKLHNLESEIPYTRIFLRRSFLGLSFVLFLVLIRQDLAYYDYLIYLLVPLSFSALLAPFPSETEFKLQKDTLMGENSLFRISLTFAMVLVLLLLAKILITLSV